jgi:hypothetical protein
VRLYSAHLKPDAEPILVREGFSWGALIFGPFWLAANRAWIAAAITLAAYVLIAALVSQPLALVLGVALAVLLGLSGHDLRRWAIERRGFLLVHVVAARGQEDALQRLLTFRPDLASCYAAGATQ